MELLDSDDAMKGKLLRKSELHREQIEEDVKLISENTERIIINALIIGGALAATYFIINSFGKDEKPKKKVRKVKLVQADTEQPEVETVEQPAAPGVLSQVGSALASQLTVMLLDLAKEKLAEFLATSTQKKQNLNGNS